MGRLENNSPCVVLHKNSVWKGLLFNSITQARNSIRWANPKTRFKEPQPNVFVCTQHGTKYQIIKLINVEGDENNG